MSKLVNGEPGMRITWGVSDTLVYVPAGEKSYFNLLVFTRKTGLQ